MEMEFKDSSRRRTLGLIVGVLLALAAGAGVFFLASQGGREDETPFLTRDVVVAAVDIPARQTIDATQLVLRTVPADASNASAFENTGQVVGQVAAVTILQFQPITPNLLASGTSIGDVNILKPTETISPLSPILRAISLSIPPERAVGGLIAVGQRVDLIATIPISVVGAIDEETGLTVDPETGDLLPYQSGTTTKLAWLDVELIQSTTEGLYVFRVDLHQAEEIAHAQTEGAQFTMVLRPDGDNREIDRSPYGETTDRILTQYNFPFPEFIEGAAYPQPSPFPTPFPAEAYLSPPPSPSPSPVTPVIGEESPAP